MAIRGNWSESHVTIAHRASLLRDTDYKSPLLPHLASSTSEPSSTNTTSPSKWHRSSLLVAVLLVFQLHTLFLSVVLMSSSLTSNRKFPISCRFITLVTKPPSSFMGGNSTKATSGINGAGTQTQQDAGIPDSAKTFFDDTKKSVCS